MPFNKAIFNLISSKREGSYWDFKEIAYENNGDFVHDVLCMANSMCHHDKYIIMGVSDPNSGCNIVGLSGDRKKQADYIDLLRNLQFADARPEIELRTITFDGKEIDVLIIYESSLKPFYLTKPYDKLLPYHIYTRTVDSNTPKDKSADFSVVERMWRQRFNLDLPPKEKFEKILDDVDNWHVDVGNEDAAYYEPSPEYQIIFGKTREGWECYSNFFINPKSFFGEAEFKYHTTTLFKKTFGFVDEFRISIATPKTAAFSLNGNYYFYYYFKKDSIRYKFHKLINKDSTDYLRQLAHNPFLVFENDEKRMDFEGFLKSTPNLEDEIMKNELGQLLYNVKNHPNMRFLAFAIDKYKEWKNL